MRPALLAVLTVGLLLGGGLVLVAAPSARATPPFAFPQSFGPPPAHPWAGAHGARGPTVPLASLGPVGTVGPTGKVGPVNASGSPHFTLVATTVKVQMLFGTAHPLAAVASPNTLVTLTNLTFGTAVSATTNTAGFVNLTTVEGWYLLTATRPVQLINFTQQVDITTVNPFLVRYLMPFSNNSVVVGNGGTSANWADVFVQGSYGWTSTGAVPQVTYTLQNISGGIVGIATAVTSNNGSAEFAHVNSAYTYRVLGDGYSQTATGVVYQWGNNTGPNFNPPSGASHQTGPYLWSWTTTTATVTGTALPTGGSSVQQWGVSSNTVIKNGTVLMGATPYSDTDKTLTFSNVVLWFDGPDRGGASRMNFVFQNTTVIFLTQSQLLGEYSGVYLNQSQLWGSTAASVFGRDGLTLSHAFSEGSEIQGGLNANANNLGFDGTFVRSVFNATVLSGGVNLLGVYHDLKGASLTGCDVENATVTTYAYLNLTSSKVAYSLLAQSVATGTQSAINSTFIGSSNTGALSNTMLQFNGAATLTHDLVTYSYPVGVNPTTYFANLNNVNVVLSTTNMSYSVVNTSVYPHRSITVLGTTLRMWNDVFRENFSLLDEIRVAANSTTGVARAQMLQVEMSHGLYANETLFDGWGNMLVSTESGNGSFNHDLFDGYMLGNAYAGFSLYLSVPTGGWREHVVLGNDTFAHVRYNSTVFGDFERQLFGPIGMDWLFDTNFDSSLTQFIGTLGINYTTFLGAPFGPYDKFASGDVLLGTNGVTSFMVRDLFANALTYDAAPVAYQNGTQYLAPFGADVNIGAGTNTVADSVFLNLTNQTLPINSVEGTQNSGWKPSTTVTGDLFYYVAPRVGGALDYRGPTFATQAPASPTDHWLTSHATASTMSYEIPLDANGTLTVNGVGTSRPSLVSNASIAQGIPPQTTVSTFGPRSGATALTWPWVVSPDVNASTGTPVVGYMNGLAAGYQPTFTWLGHHYGEAVEPTVVRLVADSSAAASVGVAFAGLTPLTNYTVDLWAANGTLVSATVILSSAAGVVSDTFAPATMPLNSTFELVVPASGGFGLFGSPLAMILLVGTVTGVLALAVLGSRRRQK